MTLETALAQKAQPKEARNVQDVITGMRPELVKSLGREDAADMLVRHYFTAIRYNELLRQCTAESLVAALLLSAQVRLEPGPLGHVYLVPFKVQGVHEVVWILGYTGIIELARRGGASALRSTIVWDCDEYDAPWENEKGVHFTLKPGPVSERNARLGLLVSWKEAGVVSALDVPAERVERAQKASPAYRAQSGLWVTDLDAMWRKTGVRAARPFLPLSVELAAAAAADGLVVSGVDLSDGDAQPTIEAGEAS